jgi:hypothetical protein
MQGNKTFIKNKEDFVCENCGEENTGDGYTNHCKSCLYSKHVDINPGDRASKCGGLMEPLEVEKKGEEYIITHQCLECGHEKKNKSSLGDDKEEIVELINMQAPYS